MVETPVTETIAEYHGRRFPIVFSGDDWVAMRAAPEDDIPDSFASGESPVGLGQSQPWVKVPIATLDGLVHIRVSGSLRGHEVSLTRRFPDGRIRVEFVGPPAVAKELGLDGDQYMGWTGLFKPEDFDDIHVEETRRA